MALHCVYNGQAFLDFIETNSPSAIVATNYLTHVVTNVDELLAFVLTKTFDPDLMQRKLDLAQFYLKDDTLKQEIVSRYDEIVATIDQRR